MGTVVLKTVETVAQGAPEYTWDANPTGETRERMLHSNILKLVVVVGSLLLFGCTSLKYQNAEGAKIEVWSFLSNKRVSGTLKADGNKRTLTVNEFDENQTDGAAKVAGAVVEAAIKSRP